jgi:hypothetical protein
VATLGVDTVHIERFTREGNRLEGTILTRTPVTRRVHYTMTFDAAGRPSRYEMETLAGDGTPLSPPGNAGSFTYLPDSVIRVTRWGDQVDTTRIPSPAPPYPTPTTPFIGVSYLMYQLAFADARRRAPTPDSVIYLLTMIPRQTTPEARRVWILGADSAEMSYFGQAKSGYRLDRAGELVRADWTGTTYRYRVSRIAAPDLDALGRAWTAADARGANMGPLSPRDSTTATLGGATITVDYSRPARRGRTIWGDVVPWGSVWRLGADFATHLQTTADLTIGGRPLPAGTYTLWMLPVEGGETQLIINSQTRIFGTQYNPARDLVRVPLTREPLLEPVERLTIVVEGGRFWIRWGNAGWWATLVAPPRPDASPF